MVVNFYRLYGTIFYTIDDHKKDAVYHRNTSEDMAKIKENYIPSETRLTDRAARQWFETNFPGCEIHKIDKHYHTTWRDCGGDRMFD